jgi:hypothetical protein
VQDGLGIEDGQGWNWAERRMRRAEYDSEKK